MSTIRDQAAEYAVVWALPLAAWGTMVSNGVEDVTGDAPWILLLRVALALVKECARGDLELYHAAVERSWKLLAQAKRCLLLQ